MGLLRTNLTHFATIKHLIPHLHPLLVIAPPVEAGEMPDLVLYVGVLGGEPGHGGMFVGPFKINPYEGFCPWKGNNFEVKTSIWKGLEEGEGA